MMGNPCLEQFIFGGEESARFARFAQSALAAGLSDVGVNAVGREPLTARPVSIRGVLINSVLDGYIRYVTIKEDDSDISHNVAGSNATRSIAARTVSFGLSADGVDLIRSWAQANGAYVPKLILDTTEGARDLLVCEAALAEPTEVHIRQVLELLESNLPQVRTEAALTLRGLSNAINASRRLQLATEAALIQHCATEIERDALVAGLEDLGYIGEDQSKAFLATVLESPPSDQACWAAAIALGRLSGGQEVWRPLLSTLRYESLWVRRAALLCLARRTQPDLRDEFEPVFETVLRETDDDLLRRYACLGLSRFREYRSETWIQLARVLADEGIEFATRGYAALAVCSAYQRCPPEIARQIRGVLETILRDAEQALDEIDSVWALEFLGELASITGLPDVSSTLYRHISGAFSDWRSHYYLAISCYELGEAEAMRAEGEDAIVRFSDAQRQLSFPMTDVPDDVSATVEFRRTIVEARRQLQGIFAQWRETHDAARIRALTDAVDAVREQYQRYATPDAQVGRDRLLARREVEYLRMTVTFMELLNLLIQLDARTRDVSAPDEALNTAMVLVAQAERLASVLAESTQVAFSFPLNNLLTEICKYLQLTSEAGRENVSSVDRLGLMWSYLNKLREAFWRSSWPMPGRACPVYGLGRAIIGIRSGDFSGAGYWNDPIVFGKNCLPILPLFIKIIDMATGGNAQLQVNYTVADSEVRTIPVHAVEDEYPLPIDLSAYAGFGAMVVDLRAIFSSRDCTQEACRSTYHVKVGIQK